jgi:uncharacterized repeat protein (TIGR03803 family)
MCSRTVPVSCADGLAPQSGLLMDASGNLYGTTSSGGTAGQGVVFLLAGRIESVLSSFCAHSGCGEIPVAGMSVDKLGNLYGTTSEEAGGGFGTVFELKR